MDKASAISESIALNIRPTPDDFVAFLPWACNQLESESTVVVTKVYQNEYISSGVSDRSKSRNRNRVKAAQSRVDAVSDRDDKTFTTQQVSFVEDALNVIAVYDNNDDLVQVSFDKNRRIPRVVLKTIGLIIKFHPQLNSVIINQGADHYTIYELEKILPMSNITNICLDGCSICDANYDILLEKGSTLRYLSLSRCKIGDEVVQNVANQLTYSTPASKSLSILNLASNMITDVGAKCLANVLRSNRRLTYLNLSDNRITDDGAITILSCLEEFCLTPEEILASKARYISFLKTKYDLVASKLKELKLGDLEKATSKKKSGRASVPNSVRKKAKGIDREGSLHSVPEAYTGCCDGSETVLRERAISIVQATLGEFTDPFSSSNLIVKDGISYCIGNNVLCYLNLAFNDLSYIFLKKLLNVLSYQRLADRKPRGLIYVSIEGNNLPTACDKLKEIETILETSLNVQHNTILHKKRPPQSKVSSK